MKRVVMFSGGAGSWGAARRIADQHGTADLTLLFTDTLVEDPDLYRFIYQAAADIGVPLIRIADGRTPRQVYRDRRMLGNSRLAPCSVELKQKPARRWMAENAPDATVILGIDWTELHRLEPARQAWLPWPVEAPLTESPYRLKAELLNDLESLGIQRPALYREGFAHNNCGGACCRAGLAQWAHLYRMRPNTFADWEATEEDLRAYLNADVSMLRDRRGGDTTPLTLRQVRERLESQPTLFDSEEWGGCGCFVEKVRVDTPTPALALSRAFYKALQEGK